MRQAEQGKLSKRESQERVGTMLTCLFAVSILYMSFYATFHLIYDLDKSDMIWHMREAAKLDRVTVVEKFSAGYNYLWHILVKAVTKLHIPKGYAACIVTSGATTSFYLLSNRFLRKNLDQVHQALIPVAAFVFCTLGPLYLPWYDERIYLAADSPNIWHSPTQLMVRPFVIVLFGMTVGIYARLRTNPWTSRVYDSKGEAALYTLTLLASTYSKPSFLQVLVPGLGMLMIVDLIRSRGKAFWFCLKMAAAFIPSVIVILLDYISSFYVEEDGGGVEIAFLEVWRHSNKSVLVSLLLLFAFPLFVFILDRRRIFRRLDGQLSLTMLLSGTAMKALLAEGGKRRYHGNFSWGYQLAAVVVWLVALKEFIRLMTGKELPEREYRIGAYVGWTLLAAHFITGLIYFFTIITGTKQC